MVSAVLPIRPEPVRRDAYQLAVDARDPRFDGVFFVGITTTRIYCRPVCKSRMAYDHHRRFFNSAAAAERAGFRPCLLCRPELAPGASRAKPDAVSQLARAAAERIAAGGLNGRCVADFAAELGVSERHLRRAMERELGVAPHELAQTNRLLLAKRLLVDTDLPMTRVAYASGFQSLRRFNVAFREQYRMPPTALRRGRRALARESGFLKLTLSYRRPFAWESLADLALDASISIDGCGGIVSVENAATEAHLVVSIAESLWPVLMPLVAGLRRVFDLDAQPSVIDGHLGANGLAALVAAHPGVRVPGVLARLQGALPDVFDATDPTLQRAAGVTSTKALSALAERWRPWRAYAARLLQLQT